MRPFLSLAAALLAAPVFAAGPVPAELPRHISADSLRGHLSFLASDLLEGRGTPSRGQDLAAEYIAAQFRRAGLEPAGDDGYFQTAHWQYAERGAAGYSMTVRAGDKSVAIPLDGLTASFTDAYALASTPVVALDWQQANADPEAYAGKVLVMPAPPVPGAARMVQEKLKGSPAAVVLIDRQRRHAAHGGWLIDPEQPPAHGPHVLVVHAADAADALAQPGATLTASLPAAATRPVKLRNVIGVLRGSDPKLKSTYVMLTSHYDHLGIRNGAIYNGANDDGSGTVSVVEIASAMAAVKERPRRSVVFMTLFGEELGLLGSKYYGRHPVFPVKDTVADLNLEQVGRTDDSEGKQEGTATVTGFDFSTLPDVLAKAGEQTGVKLWKHAINSDRFFARSDNQSLADLGVPAHTLCVAFAYPDYHGKDDHWDKIDYANMAKVNRMVAVGLYMLANDESAPRWKADNPKAARYQEAATKLHAAQ